MTEPNEAKPYYKHRLYRLASAVFGLFLMGVGLYVLCFGVVDPAWRIGLGLLIALLGINALWAAIQAKAAWLRKLGPLP
ncbi:hypothetical protein SAMN05216206_1735 [Pseudomonas guineae]|uniref:Uncharacterized protein n=1 Tax=Pseudomonas guineae TaxID=425504 RepID=A0A1I3G188_9PSED|nr:hypothetical protein [Pseudomonas guineae]SFI17255.1 hypothetical protein SAMN05216206_1735 [Pseudomonas guineae]